MRKFSEAVREVLHAAHRTQDDLAAKVGMQPSTFRTRLARNAFTWDEASVIVRELGMEGADEPKDHYQLAKKGMLRPRKGRPGGPASTLTLFEQLDRESGKVQRSLAETKRLCLAWVDAMEASDVLVTASMSVTPLEMEDVIGVDLRVAVAKAVARGVTFLYLRPTKSYLKAFQRVWKFSRMLDHTDFDREISLLREFVADYLVQTGEASRAAAEKTGRLRIPQYFCPASPFWVPGFSFGLWKTFRGAGQGVSRVTVRPTRDFGLIWITNDTLIERFGLFVDTALRDIKNAIDGTLAQQEAVGVTDRELDARIHKHLHDVMRDYRPMKAGKPGTEYVV